MASKETTSRISPVVIGSGRNKSTTYIGTKVTGPTVGADGKPSYSSEIVQYSSASGSTPVVIGSRNAETGDIAWNSNASGRTKLNESKFIKASNHQIQSLENKITSNSAERTALNKAAGQRNQDLTDGGGENKKTKSVQGGQGGRKSRYSSGVLQRLTSGAGGAKNFGGGSGGGGGGIARESFPRGLVYPTTLRQSSQDRIKISVLKYEPKKLGGRSGLGFSARSSMSGRIVGDVTLPIPGGISDKNATEWGQGKMSALDIMKADAVKSFLGGSADEAAKSIKKSVDAASKAGGDVTQAMANIFTENLTGTTDLLSRTEGAVMNPNMELLFRGPTLRPFSFTWRLSPRDESESITIKKMIRMFKQSMAPKKTQAQLFLKAPNTYKIEYLAGSSSHPFLPKIKECALNDLSVNYTPDGNYMTYDNSSMLAYEVGFSFQEIEPIYNNDMDSSDLDIGF
jgi:hypothetical protein